MSQLTDSKKFLHTLKAWNSARIFPFQCYTKLKIPATGKRVSRILIGQFKAHRLLIGCFRESLKQMNQKRKRKTNKQTRTTRTFNNKKEINWNALFFRVFFLNTHQFISWMSPKHWLVFFPSHFLVLAPATPFIKTRFCLTHFSKVIISLMVY